MIISEGSCFWWNRPSYCIMRSLHVLTASTLPEGRSMRNQPTANSRQAWYTIGVYLPRQRGKKEHIYGRAQTTYPDRLRDASTLYRSAGFHRLAGRERYCPTGVQRCLGAGARATGRVDARGGAGRARG